MGPDWFAWRGAYEISLRSGLLRWRFPTYSAEQQLARELGVSAEALSRELVQSWRQSAGRFFLRYPTTSYREVVAEPEHVVEMGDAAGTGRFLFFGRWWANLGTPPDWALNPVTGTRYPTDTHWTQIPDLSPTLGDIKYVWEASRFTHVPCLVRSFASTRNERYAETFWNHVETWNRTNPVEQGPHWRCSQELSLRSLNWIFGLYAFQDSPAATPERVAALLTGVWAQTRHVQLNHWYATRCIRNDHALTEAAALYTVGTLFPFLPGAAGWRQLGLRSLTREASWQVYEDGSYVLHSLNYARVVVQLLTWVASLARANCETLPGSIRESGIRLLQFLLGIQDDSSGMMPNYGPNDGALIFPLSSCDVADFRPSLQALSAALGEDLPFPAGPWDEEAAWFLGPDWRVDTPLAIRTVPRQSAFSNGGYYVLRGVNTHALIRCASYRHRPIQADMLHLDIWYDGANVLVDPGTYSYNAPAPWNSYFPSTAAHNAITVDGRDQMRKGDRFLWHMWTRSRLRRFESHEDGGRFDGEHYSYDPIVHRRQVVLKKRIYVVIDDVFGSPLVHDYRLHWLLNDFALEPDRTGALIHRGGSLAPLRLLVRASVPGELRWARADEQTPRGWRSLYYGERQPAWSCELVSRGAGIRFVTLLGSEDDVQSMAPRVEEELHALGSTEQIAVGV
jgi:hypothetical protein